MIGFNGQYLTAAAIGDMSITAMSQGDKILLWDWLVAATKAAILSAFGAEGAGVIQATNAYLNGLATTDREKAQALAGFINEDPMLVCSIVETSKTRWLVGDGKAWIDTGHIFASNKGERRALFRCTATGSAYRYWGCYQDKVGRSMMCYPISNKITLGFGDGANGDYNTGVDAVIGDVYDIKLNADNGTATYEVKRNGEIAASGSYTYQKTIVLPGVTEPLFCDKEAGIVKFISPMEVVIFETKEEGYEQTLIPHLHGGEAGMLDLVSLDFYPNANTEGSFTIALTDKP